MSDNTWRAANIYIIMNVRTSDEDARCVKYCEWALVRTAKWTFTAEKFSSVPCTWYCPTVAMSSDSDQEDFLLFQEFKKWKEHNRSLREDGEPLIVVSFHPIVWTFCRQWNFNWSSQWSSCFRQQACSCRPAYWWWHRSCRPAHWLWQRSCHPKCRPHSS